jgi:putative ABC transport system ATP-binding protein
VGAYISVASLKVLKGDLSLGIFLSTIAVFHEVGATFATIYNDFIMITRSFEPLARLTTLYNKKTDLQDNMERLQWQRADTREALEVHYQHHRKTVGRAEEDPRPITDRLDITLSDVGYTYKEQLTGLGGAINRPVLQNLHATVRQGEVVAIAGGPNSGKTTLLKLLSQETLPSKGDIFIPSHLRVVSISETPMFMEMGVYENLTFGLHKPSAYDKARVREMLGPDCMDTPRALDLMEKQLRHADDIANKEMGVNNMLWPKELPATERAKLHLLRALVMNPEVLVCRRPLSHFTEKVAEDVLDVLLKYVDNRGVCLPGKSKDRRPRTLFLSVDHEAHLLAATWVWALLPQQEKTFTLHVAKVDPAKKKQTSRKTMELVENLLDGGLIIASSPQVHSHDPKSGAPVFKSQRSVKATGVSAFSSLS